MTPERLAEIEGLSYERFTIDIVDRPMEGAGGLLDMEAFWASLLESSSDNPRITMAHAAISGQLRRIRAAIQEQSA